MTGELKQDVEDLKDYNDSNGLTYAIIGAAYRVANILGIGFPEKIYENALAFELSLNSMHVDQQEPIRVAYKGKPVGEFCVDLVVEHQVLVEIKATTSLSNLHVAQCLNYLKASELPLCLLLNFGGPKVTVKHLYNNRSAQPFHPLNPADPVKEAFDHDGNGHPVP